MSGWTPVPHEHWEADRLEVVGVRWPRSLAILDLRYWADPLACRRKPRPSIRELAAVWGWSSSRVHRLIASDAWRDPRGTPAGQSRDSRPPKKPDNSAETGQSRDTRGTAPKGDTRAVTQNPEPTNTTPFDLGNIGNASAADVLALCDRAVSAIYRRPRRAAKTSAGPVLRLWRAEGRPDPLELASTIERMIAAVDAGAEGLGYLRDVRGTDYSKKVATVCKIEAWSDKVEALRTHEGDVAPVTGEAAWELIATRRKAGHPAPRRNGAAIYWRFVDDVDVDDRIVAAIEALGGWGRVTAGDRDRFLATWETST